MKVGLILPMSDDDGRGTPSWPTTTVVIPWLTAPSASGCAMSPSSAWLCVSMKPGARTKPVASTTVSPGTGAGSPTSAILPSAIRTLPLRPCAPVPSTRVALTISVEAGTTSAVAAWGSRFVAAVNFADTGAAVWISGPPKG